MAGLLTRRLEGKRLPDNLSDLIACSVWKDDSQLRDSWGLAPHSHFNPQGDHALFFRLQRYKEVVGWRFKAAQEWLIVRII